MPNFETTKFFDRNGKLLYEVFNPEKGRQTYVALEDISSYVIDATISVEDKNYNSHFGIDPGSILRAIWLNIESGRIVSGGSTIPQQFIKNIFSKNSERTFARKIEESILAIRLNFLYSKEDILEKYLNTVYYGNMAYGIEAASLTYFGKSASLLDLAESSLLAGIPQAPGKYDPFTHFEQTKRRQKTVLRRLREDDKISSDDESQIFQQPIRLQRTSTPKIAPHFVDAALSQLSPHIVLNQGNIKVQTTVDSDLQKDIERIVQNHILSLSHRNVTNGAVVVIENRTGDILTLLGSQDYWSDEIDGVFNVAIAKRQPGSSIKPIVYATAFEQGYHPATIVRDEESKFYTEEGFAYYPKNFDLQYHGSVSLRHALGNSLNIPAVKVLNVVGVESVISTSSRMGIITFDKPAGHYGLSLTLGGGEVKLLELCHAYQTLASGGRHKPLQWFTALEGTEFAPGNDQQDERVLSPETAYFVTHVLQDPDARMASFGEDNILKTPFPAAVKTGTTRNFRDNWTLGYSSRYTVCVWVGNNDASPMQEVTGIHGAGPIWRNVMERIHREGHPPQFHQPGTLQEQSYCYHDRCWQEVFRKDQDFREFLDEQEHKDTINNLITNPLHLDQFRITSDLPREQQKILLQARENVIWFADEKKIGTGRKIFWQLTPGEHEIQASTEDGLEQGTVRIVVETNG